ncbi:uncharacterized protein BDZ99DRAFT_56492 [Mytilinidion resinicola]|uniref:Uncharacterized protein n=1 Tax=Mytilinidion resinicola TaxID=574789 RepID=A0A6A6YI13_9PEZI|nr:uncharacterized protein BDZ99DRAFT_56492 [Mytilinidion resinicola]KAF2808476.1 hypothetical protein BDZ99DRAFT_56492 [Mytilinidion resinicola]
MRPRAGWLRADDVTVEQRRAKQVGRVGGEPVTKPVTKTPMGQQPKTLRAPRQSQHDAASLLSAADRLTPTISCLAGRLAVRHDALSCFSITGGGGRRNECVQFRYTILLVQPLSPRGGYHSFFPCLYGSGSANTIEWLGKTFRTPAAAIVKHRLAFTICA